MTRVVLISSDLNVAALQRLMLGKGIDVLVSSQLVDRLVGDTDSGIMVDEFLAQEEAALLYGSGPVRPAPVGLLPLLLGESQSPPTPPTAAPIYGSPRPYLKRKKGRS